MIDSTKLISIIGTENEDRTADIIFVHGLGGNALSTWHPQGKKEADNSWLTWLGEELTNLGIWSLAYEVEPFRWRGYTMPLVERAINIGDLLYNAHDIGERSVIFVTHSMGGLVVKQLLRHAHDFPTLPWNKIVEQTKGIVFLSTPHSGADIANWMQYIGKIVGTSVSVEELKTNNSHLRELNRAYLNYPQLNTIPISVYYENKTTSGVLVVDQDSANPGMQGVFPVALDEDHITIAKPKSQNSRLYLTVKKFIKNCVPNDPVLPSLPRDTEITFQTSIYSKLQDYLEAKDWKKADEETSRVMCEISGKLKEGRLNDRDIHNFSKQERNQGLKYIDRLWVDHSNGKFGFSVQKEIYIGRGGISGKYDDKIWKDFCHTVGWKIELPILGWRTHSELIFDLDKAPVGHLPSSPRHAPAFGVHRSESIRHSNSIKGLFALDNYVGVYTLLPYLFPYI